VSRRPAMFLFFGTFIFSPNTRVYPKVSGLSR
jgi:hypothetical protein